MQIRDYWLVLVRRWWIIALVCLVALGTSVVWSKLQTPIYRSTVRLTVSPSRFDYGLTLVIENLLRQYSQMLQTDKLALAVDDRLKLDLSGEKLRSKVTVSAVPEDYLLQMDVDDADPNKAYDIAYVWADEFVKQQKVRMADVDPRDRIEVEMLDNPIPAVLNRPKTVPNAIAGAILGILLGGIVAFVLEYLDDTIKTPEDAERYASLTVLGTIPAMASTESAVAEPRGG